MVCPSYYDGSHHNKPSPSNTFNTPTGQIFRDSYLAHEISRLYDISIIRHFFGFPIFGAPPSLHEAAIVCLNASWWQHSQYPTTELGIAELITKGLSPTIHAENILRGMRVAHARIMPNAHLLNQYTEAGDPEAFNFGTTKFITIDEAKDILINTFVRPRLIGDSNGTHQPIIFIGHAVQNFVTHIKDSFGVDLMGLGTIVKVIDRTFGELSWKRFRSSRR